MGGTSYIAAVSFETRDHADGVGTMLDVRIRKNSPGVRRHDVRHLFRLRVSIDRRLRGASLSGSTCRRVDCLVGGDHSWEKEAIVTVMTPSTAAAFAIATAVKDYWCPRRRQTRNINDVLQRCDNGEGGFVEDCTLGRDRIS